MHKDLNVLGNDMAKPVVPVMGRDTTGGLVRKRSVARHNLVAFFLDLLYASLRMPLAYCYSKSFQGVSSVARPEHGGENMTAVWASPHEALGCDGVVAPHGFVPLIGSDLGVVLDRCDPPGAAVDAGLEAATQVRRAERTADGGVVDVPQALHVSPHAPRINAQRVPRFDHYCTHKCLSAKELRRNIQ